MLLVTTVHSQILMSVDFSYISFRSYQQNVAFVRLKHRIKFGSYNLYQFIDTQILRLQHCDIVKYCEIILWV